MDSIAIKDLTKKLDDIKSDNLSNLEKFDKANEIIGKNLDTYKSKINDAKDKISKLSPESAKKANEQLDQTSLLVRDANLPNHSFDELDQRIKDLLFQDKETAKSKINSIPDSKLTKKQKEDLVKLIDSTDTNDWAKITDIINKAEIDVAKKDLEDQAKLLNYPDGDKSKAIKSLINQINSSGSDKLDTKEKIEKFKKKLDSIKSRIDEARDLINTLDITKQNDLNKKLNDADTIEKLDSIIKEINDAIKVEQIKAIKDELDSYVDNLSYPSINAPAKNEIKETYKNINDLNQLNQIKEKITNDTTGIESKIIKAKLEIDKLPINEQSELNKVLDSANTDQEFVDLDKKIEAAKNKNKVENKKTIDALSDLPEDLKNRLKDEIDNALTSKEINRIKNKAELLAKIEQLKKVITPNDYALANDDDVKKIINETISKLKTSIDGIEENQVQTKKTELDGLKSKLVELKKEIEGLEEKDVLDASKTKKDLAIQLAQDINDESIEDTKLFIKKARLKKKVSELDYPNKQNALAIDKLNTRINDATKDNVNEIETLINNLPNKISEAKNLINGVNKNNNNAEDARRRQDLTEQLNRTVTEEEFEQLKKNIESAKTQSTEEYNNALKDRLKQQVNALEYPIPSTQTEPEAKKKLIDKIDTLKQSDLETFDDTIDKIGKKIAEAKNKISKLSPSKADSGILQTSKTSELSDFDKLLQKLDQLRNEDRNEINKKIEELNELTLEEKTKYKNDVNLADSYSDMLNILKKARDKHLEKIVDKLPYPTNNGRARSMLKKSIIDANTNNDNTFNAKVKSFEQIKKLIIDAKTRIEQLPYSKQNTPGRKFLNDKLDEATTETEIKEIANDELKQKIQKYKELIQKVGDFTLPKPNQNNLINGRLDHLPDTNENDLKKQIYETKRQQVALREINKLSNIKQKDKKDKLKNDIVAWKPTVDNNLSIDDFIKKVNDVDKKIIDAYKEDLKAKVDALPYPNPNSNEAQTAKNTLKSEIEKLSTKAQSNDEYAN
ncbi:hypothetical protein OM999_01105 [Mycoplasmopsis cynos]|uniref:hypothetical protein n=1 Tax=Mycoplasmopsis cynos TaxID=171284 RepID=UPI0024CB3FD6|nr:hypothetical protein OM999_01105 [Mycoplasmopsis cynos]